MAFPGEAILTDLIRRLVDKTIKEVSYFRHFETHDFEFKQVLELWERKLEKVQEDIKDAKRYNQYQNDREIHNLIVEAENWISEAEDLIQKKAEIRSTRFDSWCLGQFRQGKRLAQRTITIQEHIKKWNFGIIACPAELRVLKYHASKYFIDFESRKTEFEQLVKALKDGNMIGLQGMGGMGKTTLAAQVGKHFEESKTFERVVFVVVSNSPDVKKIQGDIAKQLDLPLKEIEEEDRSVRLWSSIDKNAKNLLIILDDVWEELNLNRIGIPFGPDNKNCYVLITTRRSNVCQAMKCQQTVRLRTLNDEDALHLFQFHAKSDNHSSRNEWEDLARGFLKECGGLPVAIVALASTLRNRHVGEWIEALRALKNSRLLVDVDEDLEKVYSCLRLSYDYLHNKKAQELFLLCSIFPEDYEFPINLVIRLGIGSGIFEEADDYYGARRQALAVTMKLIDSSLLQKVGEKECVKMHDLVREVAQWIAKKDIQVIQDSRTTLKTNTRFVFWSTGDFPDLFDDTSGLEILLLWISGNVLVKDPNAFFAGMSRLKILFLLGECDRKVHSPSLSKSLLSLKYIQTLILDSWELGDISILNNIQSLVTLELKNCLIIELPRNIMELKKLRWLGMRNCEIQKNNPFEVIEKCSQLEEVYFVENFDVEDWNNEGDKEIEDETAQDISPPKFQVFSIAYNGFECFPGDDNGLRRCFNSEHDSEHIKHLISDAMFKNLVRSAEVLELGKIRQSWKNLAPDVIALENPGLDNLIKLYLYEWDDIECLIDNSNFHDSNTTFFSNLVELHLNGVDVKQLYRGAMPSRFLGQLQVLELMKCMKLQNIFFDENIKLPHLKVLRLIGCPMFQQSIFQPSIAQSLERLEELVVEDCEELKSLIEYERLKQGMAIVGSQKNYDLLFPVLKSLQIVGCGKLEMTFSLLLPGDLPMLKDLHIYRCKELKYIFGEYRVVGQVSQQEIILPLLTEVTLYNVPSFIRIFQNCQSALRSRQYFKEDSKEKHENSKASAFSWAYRCCFLAPTKNTNIGVLNATKEHHTISQGSCGLSKMMETLNTPECLMRHPLSLQNIREMSLDGCSKLKSLFSLSIAKTIMLEKLKIWDCEELKHIITNEAENDDNLNCTSIFPKLQSLMIWTCNKLEFIFPSTLSGGLQKLKSINIVGVHELKYVFGKYNEEECLSNEKENNDEPHIHLSALESLYFSGVPNMISIGIKKYQQKCPSLQIVEAPKEIKKHMQDVTSERAKEPDLQEIVNVETPLTPTVGFQYFLNFHNLKQIVIWRNKKLKTLFSVSACRNLPQLSKLSIHACEELVNVVEDDSHDHHHMNSSSIFPKLEDLTIEDCNKLEFIFPLSLFGTLQKFNSLIVKEAAELNCIFEIESDELHIHLPATLERLSFVGVPKIMNKILAKKYHVSFLSLQSIEFGDLQEFNGRSFLDLLSYLQEMQLNKKAPKDLMKIIKNVQKLTKLGIRDSKIEEVLNLEGVEIEGIVLTLSLEEMWLKDLSELNHICKGPKYIFSLPNLHQLDIIACKKLRVIFSVSIVKSLPQLSYLKIEDCNELVDIIEESVEGYLHQICFPKLKTISINRCNSLKCLLSISTCGMFPKLWLLNIEEAYELEQVFIHKKDDMQKMTMMDEVFPELLDVTLRNLPRLVTICEGIDFKNVRCSVNGCPKYQGINDIQEGPEDMDSENQAATNVSPNFIESSKETMTTSVEEVASSFSEKEIVKEIEAKDPTPALLEKQVLEASTTKPQLRSTSLHIMEETLIEIQAKDSNRASGKQASETSVAKSHLRGTSLPELEDKLETSESIMQLQQEDLSIDVILKERAEEGSTSEDVVAATMVADLAPRNSWDLMPSKSRSERLEPTSDIMIASVTSSVVSQVEGSKSGPSTLVNLVTRGIKDTMEQGLKDNYPEDDAMISVRSTNSYSRKRSTVGPTDNLSRKDSAMSAKEEAKGVNEKATATYTLPMATPFESEFTVEEAGDHSSVQKEAKSEKPIKAILPRVIPPLHYQSQYVDAGSSSPKLEIWEIFRLVVLKHGEVALLAQALEKYPQLLLPRANRTDRIIALSYRVLVDILVMLDTKTPNTITQLEKTNLEGNLCDAIVLGFDKDWVESIRAKVLGVDMSDVSATKDEIQVMEVKL